jgi:beta-phosphoglucomutase-like phosphatase (HAD superfamily)
MAALGVGPQRSVVIEDSQAGASAGLAAGCAVLAVPSMQPVEPAPGLVLRESLVGVDVDVLTQVLATASGTELTGRS